MKQHLNFDWQFIAGFSSNYVSEIPNDVRGVDIPHNITEFPFNNFSDIHHQIIGTYFKKFDIIDYDPESSYVLAFDGVMVSCNVFINGKDLGEFSHGYLPFEIDVSDYIKPLANLLVVKVDGREDNKIPPWGNVVDYLSFAGIYREVALKRVLPLDIIDARVDGKLDGTVVVRPEFINNNNSAFSVEYQVYDDKNQLVASAKFPRFKVENHHVWSLENPYLYRLKIVVTSIDDHYQSSREFTLAFRSIEVRNTGFYLNNRYLKLVGLNRHETYPFIGGAASKSLQADDVKILKQLGLNYVRCSHYPPSPHFLDACDRLGLLVVDEVPGWQHIGDREWQKVHLDNISRMIKRDYNHPSIFAWSIRINESMDHHELYTRGQELAKSLDQYRPTTGTRNIKNSEIIEDIYSYNDFSHFGKNKGLEAKKQVTKTSKPYIVSECNGHMYPTKVYDSPQRQLEFAHRHLAVLNSAFKDLDIIGISPWCMHDYYTHSQFGSGDHICYHGILDIYRNKKLVADVYLSQLVKEDILASSFSLNNGDIPEAKLMPFFVFSNAEQVHLFRGDDLIKKYQPRRDLYRYLKHPPFVIDYFIRENFTEKYGRFGRNSKKRLGKILNYAALNGLNQLKISHKISLGFIMFRYRLNYQNLVEIWGDNVSSWGSDGGVFTLKAYNREGQLMKTRQIGPSSHYQYQVDIDKSTLINGASYDTVKVNILALDSNDMRSPYDFSPVKISVDGPIRILGPDVQSLHGGALSIYIASKNIQGSAHLMLTINDKIYKFDIKVK